MIRSLAAALWLCAALPSPLLAGGETSRQEGVIIRLVRTASTPFIGNQAIEIEAAARRGEVVRIVGRHCYSSCTMWLRIACVMPDARLGFHRPSFGALPMTRRDFVAAVRFIAAHYPTPELRRWFATEVVTRPGDHWLTGAELAERFGVDLCDG